VRTSGLVIFRNAAALPPAGVLPANDTLGPIVASDDPSTIQRLPATRSTRLAPVEGGWAGMGFSPGIAVVATGFGSDWRLTAGGRSVPPAESFGWSLSFPVPAGDRPSTAVAIRFTAQWIRTVETIVLGLLWAAALWITRKPVAR
jgi:hypothetical protein